MQPAPHLIRLERGAAQRFFEAMARSEELDEPMLAILRQLYGATMPGAPAACEIEVSPGDLPRLEQFALRAVDEPRRTGTASRGPAGSRRRRTAALARAPEAPESGPVGVSDLCLRNYLEWNTS
jgi:hypothetical protein